MNQFAKRLALIAGIVLIALGAVAYLSGHHRLGEIAAVLGVIAGGASIVLPQARTS